MSLLAFLKTALENDNVKAFLQTIRKSEGTDAPDGYSYLFGSSPRNTIRFAGFIDHPRIHRPFGTTTSSAAGAYQIMQHTWDDEIQPHLQLPDFTPQSQDIACCYLISAKNVLQRLMNGEFDVALRACNKVWASLPGSPYGQPVHSREAVEAWYQDAGGTIA